MIWTKDKRAAYMREYRAKNREWMRVTWQLWYQANRDARNRRRRKAYAAAHQKHEGTKDAGL